MLSVTQLSELSTTPKINEISYKLLAEYYSEYLLGTEYRYSLNYSIDGQVQKEVVSIYFNEENFCHLLGIETIAKPFTNSENISQYKGELGWSNAINGDLTMDNLKKLNKKGFKNNKDKAIFFYLIPKILINPKIIKFDKSIVKPKTTITSKFVFYENTLNAYVHIGMDCRNGKYFPRSLFIERINKNNSGDKYITNQTEVTIEEIKIIN